MRENNFLAPDVDLDDLADRTKNYSGAEIEGLVKSAASYAFDRYVFCCNDRTLAYVFFVVAKSMHPTLLSLLTPLKSASPRTTSTTYVAKRLACLLEF